MLKDLLLEKTIARLIRRDWLNASKITDQLGTRTIAGRGRDSKISVPIELRRRSNFGGWEDELKDSDEETTTTETARQDLFVWKHWEHQIESFEDLTFRIITNRPLRQEDTGSKFMMMDLRRASNLRTLSHDGEKYRKMERMEKRR